MSAAEQVQAYEEVLAGFGRVLDFDISRLDRLGVPVTSCSLLRDGRLAHHGNGYGATVEAARLSGLGELAEGVLAATHMEKLRRSARRGSYAQLVAAEGPDRVADPATLCLPAGSAWTPDTPLTWVPVERVRTGETVWAPLDLVASDPSELDGQGARGAEGLVLPVTNGLGAGLDPARPVAHGIGEILQRHTNGLRFRALDARSPEIAPDGLPASVAALVDRFRAVGIEPVLKHAATAYGVRSTYVMGLDADDTTPIRLTACGEAADPSAERSLLKALLEYANSRARKAFCYGRRGAAQAVADPAYWAALPPGTAGAEPRALASMRSWHALGPAGLRSLTAPTRSRIVAYADVVGPPVNLTTPADQLAHLLDALAGHDVLVARTRLGEVHVAKTLVSGLEVETLSYGRIGELNARESLEADLGLVRLADDPTASHPDRIVLTPEAEERLGGPAWYSHARAAEIVGPLYPLYREPPRHSVEV